MFETELDIWDLKELNQKYSIDWTTRALDPKRETFTTPEGCYVEHKALSNLLIGGPKHWKQWDEKCPNIINIGTDKGLLYCGKPHRFCGDIEHQKAAFDIYCTSASVSLPLS